MIKKRFTWLKKDVYAPKIVITDSLTEKDLGPTDCYKLLNELAEENEQLKQKNDNLTNMIAKVQYRVDLLKEEGEQLKQQLQKIRDSFEVSITQNHEEFNKDKLYIKDTNTKLRLDGEDLFIEVYIPQIKEYYRFKYKVAAIDEMREFIEMEVYNDRK